ncbi:MAG: methyltransferase domain-containing protein [Frankiales bacterium]|nr:MAG: methyltransferase domain-containing protein [Frankiales bacterium]
MPAPLAALLVLLSSAAVLVLEILVSRLVAPYVGLTLETYTAAIGVALAAIAAGAALGGRLADRADPRRWLGPATALGGALVLTARPTVFAAGDAFRGTGPVGTVVLVLLAVAPAALVLSLVPPGVVKLRLRTLAETGQTVGRLSAVGTLGALAGTFLTGFVLLSAFATSTLLLLTGLVLVVTGLVVAVVLPRLAVPVAPMLAVLLLSTLTASWLVVADGPCEYETRYYCATVEPDPRRDGGRTLVLDGLRHSYVDLDDPAHLEFRYTQRIADVIEQLPPGPLDVLHLGLGGGSVPRHVAAVRPGSTGTVLEVDPEIPRIGRSRLGLGDVPALEVRVGDARTEIAELPSRAYDVVVGDAFGSLAVPWHLATAEMVAEVRRVLRPGGVYALNVIDFPPLAFVRAETATLLDAFRHVLVMAPPSALAGETGGNLVLVGSDDPLPTAGLARSADARGEPESVHDGDRVRTFAGGAQVLVDDDAPVDQLLTPYRPPRA